MTKMLTDQPARRETLLSALIGSQPRTVATARRSPRPQIHSESHVEPGILVGA